MPIKRCQCGQIIEDCERFCNTCYALEDESSLRTTDFIEEDKPLEDEENGDLI